MSFSSRQRIRVAWIALVAMLLSTLAPTVSQAIAPAPSQSGRTAATQSSAAVSPDAFVGEICSVPAANSSPSSRAHSGSGSLPAGHGGGEHCPYCLSHNAAGVPPAAIRVACAPQGATSRRATPDRSFAGPGTWPAAQPRAPPARA